MIPYFAQWESPDLVGPILRREIAARDDPRWRASGASDPEEYEFWSWRACGMACLRSVLATRRGVNTTTVGLGREVLAAGGYRLRAGGSGLDGLIYAPFVDYVAARWDLATSVEAPLAANSLVKLLHGGSWVMASVNPRIRRPDDRPADRGGHLVLVHGLEGASTLIFHNPSGDTPASQASVRMEVGTFTHFYAGRAVSFPPGVA